MNEIQKKYHYWELIKLCVYWVSEKQNNRFIEEASFFNIDISNEDVLYSDLINYHPDEGLKEFLTANGFGITKTDLTEIEKISLELEQLEELNENWSEKVYKVAVGMLYLLSRRND